VFRRRGRGRVAWWLDGFGSANLILLGGGQPADPSGVIGTPADKPLH